MGRILIIDDNRQLVLAYEETLKRAGFSILKSYDGWDALGKMRNEKFDLVITDLKMPKMSGIDLIESLRKEEIETISKTPIIISSGFIDDSIRAKFKIAGIHFLPKPVIGRTLIAKVKEVLALPKKKSTVDVEILNAIIKGVRDTIVAITGDSLNVTRPVLKLKDEPSGDISGVMTVMSSNFRGSVAVSFQKESFMRIMGKFLQMDQAITLEDRETINDILSIIFDAAHFELRKQGTCVRSEEPTVVTSPNHCVDHKQNSPTFAINFIGKEFGTCRIEVCSSV